MKECDNYSKMIILRKSILKKHVCIFNSCYIYILPASLTTIKRER